MTLVTVEGTYKDRKVELPDPPAGVQQARVLVTFLPAESETGQSSYMKLGQFRGSSERMSTEEDFKAAEWHPTEKDLNGD